LSDELYNSRVIGVSGGLLNRQIEIRDFDDPRLRPWGRLQNEQEDLSRQLNAAGWNRNFVMECIGGLFTFCGAYAAFYEWRFSRKNPESN
jgi:hypothetical protein